MRAFAHVDDPLRAQAYVSLLADGAADAYDALSLAEQRLARMLFYSLWYDGGGHDSIEAGLLALRTEQATRAEISTVETSLFPGQLVM